MTDEQQSEEVQRWTAKRRAALVISVLRGETTAAEADELEPAIAEWSRAGEAAQERSAFAEAEKSYEHALGLLDLLPESAGRDLRELELKQSTEVWNAGFVAMRQNPLHERSITIC
jgi:hypothetical protein